MATHAHSTPAPVDRRGLLPAPAPLPGLPEAFTRRRAILGLAALSIAALPVAAAAAAATAPADARLAAIADEMHAIERDSEAFAKANPVVYEDHPVWFAYLDRSTASPLSKRRWPTRWPTASRGCCPRSTP